VKAPHLHPDQTPEERAAQARLMAARRWAGTTAEERSAFAREVASHREYPWRIPDPAKARCPCGRMTLARALARADKAGTGLGHAAGCAFYRRQRRPGKRRPLSGRK